jgi:glyoxylase-like metal-dependent hydrolase (beta-lactamase superfamily II)
MTTEVRRVSPTILCLRRASYLTCSYMVARDGGITLVDAGMSSDGADVRAGLDYLGAEPRDIRAILLTHWHNDHSAGARAARDLSAAPVYYHSADESFFTGKTGARGLRGWISELIPEWGVLVLAKGLLGEATPRAVEAQHFVHNGDVLFDDFVVLETPGHTDGHVAYYYRPEGALFAGDALAVIGRRIRFMARPVTLDEAAARRSLAKCLELRPTLLCPGHREPLVEGVQGECDRMLAYLDNGGRWPLFG